MPPAEYHWIERLVYERWRGALKKAGSYPDRACAPRPAEVDGGGRARDRRPRARPPRAARRRDEGPRAGAARRVRSRRSTSCCCRGIDDIERYSLDDVVAALHPDALSWGAGRSPRRRAYGSRRLRSTAGTAPSPPTRGRAGTPRRRPSSRARSAAAERPRHRPARRGSPATRSESSANAAGLCSRRLTA